MEIILFVERFSAVFCESMYGVLSSWEKFSVKRDDFWTVEGVFGERAVLSVLSCSLKWNEG